jgi:hypothetical protein
LLSQIAALIGERHTHHALIPLSRRRPRCPAASIRLISGVSVEDSETVARRFR